MPTIVAIAYPDQWTAERARGTVFQLEDELIVRADEVAVISRDVEGRYHVHTAHDGRRRDIGYVLGTVLRALFLISSAESGIGAG